MAEEEAAQDKEDARQQAAVKTIEARGAAKLNAIKEEAEKQAKQAAQKAEADVQKAEQGSFDPMAPGARENIENIRDKIKVARQRAEFAKQAETVDRMKEMTFKVQAKS